MFSRWTSDFVPLGGVESDTEGECFAPFEWRWHEGDWIWMRTAFATQKLPNPSFSMLFSWFFVIPGLVSWRSRHLSNGFRCYWHSRKSLRLVECDYTCQTIPFIQSLTIFFLKISDFSDIFGKLFPGQCHVFWAFSKGAGAESIKTHVWTSQNNS